MKIKVEVKKKPPAIPRVVGGFYRSTQTGSVFKILQSHDLNDSTVTISHLDYPTCYSYANIDEFFSKNPAVEYLGADVKITIEQL